MQDFIFSQSSLQDYVDCPRRFQLRYLLHCEWPAVETAPILESERHMARGQAFHRLAHQHALGLPADLLTSVAAYAELSGWWESFLSHPPAGLPDIQHPEMELAASVAGHLLVAKYDLIALDKERLVIVDWKTNLRRPARAVLEYRLQTRVYPFVLAAAGAELRGGGPVPPSQIEMTYWFAEFPQQTETFRYSAEGYAADARYLGGLIGEIAACRDEVFALTQDSRRCRFCVYRSLCRRDVPAGSYADEEAEDMESGDMQVDLEQVAEVVY